MISFFTITVTDYLIVSSILFSIGMFGVIVSRKSIINVLMSIELLLLSVNINFIAFSSHLNDLLGQISVLFILAVAAAEAAIGLAILVTYYRNKGTIEVNDISNLRG
jgi:NADH-quinone oxidoreductase subunit K